MDISQFIDNVVAGNAAAAKQNLNDILSSKAFEAIDGQKKNLSKSLFNGISDDTETSAQIQDTEDKVTEQ